MENYGLYVEEVVMEDIYYDFVMFSVFGRFYIQVFVVMNNLILIVNRKYELSDVKDMSCGLEIWNEIYDDFFLRYDEGYWGDKYE